MIRIVRPAHSLVVLLGLTMLAIQPAGGQDSSHVTRGAVRPREILKQTPFLNLIS